MEQVWIGRAAGILGVSVTTLRRWDRLAVFEPDSRTAGGHRRYRLDRLLTQRRGPVAAAPRRAVAYARVSGHDQKGDLQRQAQRLRRFCEENGWAHAEVIEDLGSGLNYRKKGISRRVRLICRGEVERRVVTHRDRLPRFGAELIFHLCRPFDTEGVILEETPAASFEAQLTADVIELMTVFAARLHGARSHRGRAETA